MNYLVLWTTSVEGDYTTDYRVSQCQRNELVLMTSHEESQRMCSLFTSHLTG